MPFDKWLRGALCTVRVNHEQPSIHLRMLHLYLFRHLFLYLGVCASSFEIQDISENVSAGASRNGVLYW